MSEFVQLGEKSVVVEGRFKLDVLKDKKKFSLTNINSFVPVGKTAKDRVRFKTESGEVESLFIDRHSVLFDPTKDVDRHNIMVFIQHPAVMLGGVGGQEEHDKLVKRGLKNPKPDFMITNVDKARNEKRRKEISILKIRSKLYNDDAPLSIEKLVWICSNFGIPYKSEITDRQRYKDTLLEKIDNYISSSEENAKKFNEAISKIKLTEMKFYINELLNAEIIENFGGIYKIEDRPIGGSIEHVIQFYEQNNDIFLGHQNIVKQRLNKFIS